MQEELERSPDTEDHLRSILSFRQKKGILKSGEESPEPRRDWTYWLSFGCVKSKSSNALAVVDGNKPKPKEEEPEPGILSLKLSPVKGVRMNKPLASVTPKPSTGTGNMAMKMAQSKSIQNLIGQDQKKAQNMFQVLKIIGTTPMEEKDEKIE